MTDKIFNDRYQIVRKLARGGMADVYLARDLSLDRPVALKVLFPEFASDPSFVERFRREARSAAKLNHPNIVSIFDWGEEQGWYFIVMEYVEGRTLRELARAEGPLEPVRAAEVAADIAGALAFAHRNGVIHRDVKPGNVMIADLVKVTDFGIARAGDPAESLTQTGAVMGTATYFSPEQAKGRDTDPRSDVYSLGVVLYEMVAGRPPFVGDSPVSVAYQHVKEPPTPPREHNPDVPPALEGVILKAMAKEPADRYPSADALRTDLLRFARGRGTLASPPPAAVAATGATRVGAATPAGGGPPADGTRVMARASAAEDEELYYEEGPPPRSSRTSTYILVLVVMLAVLGGLLYLLARELGVGSAAKVEVPPVVGEQEDRAVSILEGAGFEVRTNTVAAEPGEQQGIVRAQDPEAGAMASEGSTVEIDVVGEAEGIELPNVVGSTLDEALSTLDDAGFPLTNVQRRADPEAPRNEVIEQVPRPGRVPQGTRVTLVASDGPADVTVPNVAGAPEADATQALRDRSFVVRRTTAESADVEAGLVIRTEPPGGTALAPGSEVTLVVSTGPAPTTTAPTTTSTTTTTSSTTTTTTTPFP